MELARTSLNEVGYIIILQRRALICFSFSRFFLLTVFDFALPRLIIQLLFVNIILALARTRRRDFRCFISRRRCFTVQIKRPISVYSYPSYQWDHSRYLVCSSQILPLRSSRCFFFIITFLISFISIFYIIPAHAMLAHSSLGKWFFPLAV